MSLRPLLYGYLSLRLGAPAEEVHVKRAALQAYADKEGYTLAQVFEDIEGSTDALSTVIDLCREGRAGVLLSSLTDLGKMPRVQALSLSRVQKTGTNVMVVNPRLERTESAIGTWRSSKWP